MRKNKNFIFVIVLVCLMIFVFHSNRDIRHIKIAGLTLKAEVASTPLAREKGLSGRKNLEENTGMLFVFDQTGEYAFWMKNMNFPIDMVWIDENFKVVYIKKDVQPESYPEVFTPNMNAKYVLEVVSGFSEKNNLKEGDSVSFF